MKAYFHLDSETTTLDATTGHIRSLGWVVTDGNLVAIRPEREESVVVHSSLWDTDTLAFAANTYGPAFIQALACGHKSWMDILGLLCSRFSKEVEIVRNMGYEPWLVVNHPEFDVTLLKEAFKRSGFAYPIKYNHHLDWQSLYLATGSVLDEISGLPISDSSKLLTMYDPVKGKANVKHTALADAQRQLGMLQAMRVRLPL